MKIARPRITASLLFLALATPVFAAPPLPTDTQTLYLSGHNKDDALPWSFSCNLGQQANTPATIPVPSNWELHNFGIFSYGLEHRGSKNHPVPPAPIVTGKYQTHFATPPSFADHRVFLVFEGSMTDTTAFINGKQVGDMHQGGYTRFKYEVTSLLQFGENTLDVTVADESANPTVNAAERRGDYFNYAGIYRPVYLEAVPQAYIDHVAINATADGNFTAKINANMLRALMDHQGPFIDHADQEMAEQNAFKMKADILDAAGKVVGTSLAKSLLINAAGQTAYLDADISLAIDHPKLWTAETPNLYTLQLSLQKGNDTLHTISQRFGFRTIDPRPDGLYLNGQRILLKGSDRHSFWPDSGRCLSEEISRLDITTMHEMNMNAVRMSHYPPDAHFLDAADEMGLYVLDELPGWHSHYDDDVGHKIVKEMLTRDVNHPSILFWDNGNEGGFNKNLDPDYAALDPQKRRVLYPWTLHDGVDTKHYPDYKTLTEKVDGPNLYFPTEFLHGLYDGGAGAGLEDFWNVIMHGKAAGGGFIWAFLDEAPKRVDLDGHLDTHGNYAPDGIVGPYREKEASFYTIKQLWSPVVITDKSLPTDGHITVENRYSFTNLKDCKFTYQLRKFPSPSDNKADFTVVAESKFDGPDIAPGDTGILEIPARKAEYYADALAMRIENPAGQELFTHVFPLADLAHASDETPPVAFSSIGVTEQTSPDGNTVSYRSGMQVFHFNKATGFLSGVTLTRGTDAGVTEKTIALSNGPRLVTGDAKFEKFDTRPDHEDLLLTATYTGDLHSIEYRFHGAGGPLGITASYHLTGPQPFIGLGFDYPEKNIKSLRWLGDGPFRVYANRTAGPTLSVWQNDYNDSVTGAIPWKYPEFKGYFQNVRWAHYQTTEGPITFLIHDDHTFLQNFTPTEPDKSLVGKTHVPYPSTNIAFLKMIPPIGSKFSNAYTTGPAAQTQPATGDYTTHLSIYFGDLK